MPNKNSERNIQLKGLAIVILALAATFYYKIAGLNVKPDFDIFNLSQFFGFLVLISLFLERATEFFLSLTRSAEADKQDRKIMRLKKELAEIMKTEPDNSEKREKWLDKIENAEDDRTEYRGESRLIALWTGVVIGISISMVGVRILGSIYDVPETSGIEHQRMFIIIDVLLTASVLAGGSQAINQIMKVYNNFMAKKTDTGKEKS